MRLSFSCQRGAATVEAALSLFPFFIVLFGIMEGARFLNVQQVLSNAAREGARFAVAPVTRTSTLPAAGEIQARVQTFLDAAAITGATITVERPVQLSVNGISTQFTRVRVQMPYTPISLAMFGNLQVTLSGEALMRNETSP